MKKIIICLLTLIFLVSTGCSVTNVFGDNIIKGKTYQNSDNYNVGSISYNDSEIVKLYVNWYVGIVKIIEGDKLEIVEENTLEQDKKVHSIIEDKTLKVQFWKSGLNSKVEKNEKHVTIYVPKNIEYDINNVAGLTKYNNFTGNKLSISSVSGDVEVGDVNCTTLDISATSGDITVGNIKAENTNVKSVSGRIEIETVKSQMTKLESTSGMVSVNGLNSDEVDIETVSGDIIIKDTISKTVDLDSVSGKVNIGFSDCEKADIETTSGSVIISINNDFGMTLSFKTTSGDFDTNMTYQVNNKKNIFGSGKCLMNIETTSGNIKVKEG